MNMRHGFPVFSTVIEANYIERKADKYYTVSANMTAPSLSLYIYFFLGHGGTSSSIFSPPFFSLFLPTLFSLFYSFFLLPPRPLLSPSLPLLSLSLSLSLPPPPPSPPTLAWPDGRRRQQNQGGGNGRGHWSANHSQHCAVHLRPRRHQNGDSPLHVWWRRQEPRREAPRPRRH